MAHVDLTFLTDFTGGSKEKMAKYINMFLGLAPKSFDDMRAQMAVGDWDKLRGTAHSLKPQITYMGIKSAEGLVRSIETNSAERRDLEKMPAMVDEFIKECNDAIEELKKAIA